jgi:hypothetical protein
MNYEVLYTWFPSRTCSFFGDDQNKKAPSSLGSQGRKHGHKNTSIEE